MRGDYSLPEYRTTKPLMIAETAAPFEYLATKYRVLPYINDYAPSA